MHFDITDSFTLYFRYDWLQFDPHRSCRKRSSPSHSSSYATPLTLSDKSYGICLYGYSFLGICMVLAQVPQGSHKFFLSLEGLESLYGLSIYRLNEVCNLWVASALFFSSSEKNRAISFFLLTTLALLCQSPPRSKTRPRLISFGLPLFTMLAWGISSLRLFRSLALGIGALLLIVPGHQSAFDRSQTHRHLCFYPTSPSFFVAATIYPLSFSSDSRHQLDRSKRSPPRIPTEKTNCNTTFERCQRAFCYGLCPNLWRRISSSRRQKVLFHG